MLFSVMMLHTIATIVIQGIINTTGTTFTPANDIAIIFAINAVIRNDRKMSATGAIR